MAKDKNEMMRRAFINSVAYIYANEGSYRATTKNISKRAGYNEAYIYRLFKSKEDLIRCAFKFNDDVFVARLLKTVPIMKMGELPFYDRCHALFMCAFEVMLSSHDHAIFYMRYYHSEQFRKNAIDDHRDSYYKIVDELKDFFKPGENVKVLLRFVFEATINIAFRVVCGDIENTPQVAEQHFALVYRAIAPGLKDELVCDARH